MQGKEKGQGGRIQRSGPACRVKIRVRDMVRGRGQESNVRTIPTVRVQSQGQG